MKSSL